MPTIPPRPQSSRTQSPLEYDSGDKNDENLDTLSPESPLRISRQRRSAQALQD